MTADVLHILVDGLEQWHGSKKPSDHPKLCVRTGDVNQNIHDLGLP